MALPVWPASLPTQPEASGATIRVLYQPPLMTEMDDGPIVRRPRSTTTLSEVTFRFALTDVQFATYQTFVRDTLHHGSRAFEMPIWKPGAAVQPPAKVVKILEEGGIELTRAFTYITLTLQVRDY